MNPKIIYLADKIKNRIGQSAFRQPSNETYFIRKLTSKTNNYSFFHVCNFFSQLLRMN